ncbi:MAG: hypothetical protein OWR62_14660 [Sulfobacillus thermotolerans]|nr:hypothetical protein [Sulfobacillus thermotolerans]
MTRQQAVVTEVPEAFFVVEPLAFPEGSLPFQRRKQTAVADMRRAYTTARLGWP